MSTWNSRGLRGSTLEELLNKTNEKYLENNLALIQKIPTPITPINIDKNTRHTVAPANIKGQAIDVLSQASGLVKEPS